MKSHSMYYFFTLFSFTQHYLEDYFLHVLVSFCARWCSVVWIYYNLFMHLLLIFELFSIFGNYKLL